MGSRVKTGFLFAQPSLVSGTARLFDLYGLYDEYNLSPTEAEADAMATLADWMIVGQDMQEALEQYEHAQASA